MLCYGCGPLNCIIIACALAILAGYAFFKRRFSYWNKRGVFTLPPSIPFGNVKNTFLRRVHFGMEYCNAYEKTSERPYVGMYMVHRPMLLVNDLDLIRTILTADFVHFTDHAKPFDEERDPLTGHLFNLCGGKWKNLRAKLTPTFTSSKMRMMFDVVAECSREMTAFLDAQLEGGDNVGDVKDVFGTYANDVIANCAFGVECNSFRNAEEPFRAMGKRLMNPSVAEMFRGTFAYFLPTLAGVFGLKFFPKDMEDFFFGIVEETVGYREKNCVFRNDFMQLLIQLKNNGVESTGGENVPDDGKHLTMKQLAAQVFMFFFAGFDTSSSTASFALYELALDPDLQNLATDEIDNVLAKHDGKITYDSLNDMTYLGQVMEETMRKYPPLPVLLRICTKDYILPGNDITIEKDTPVMIPMYAIQRNPKYFPEPEKFDPERFNPENKLGRHPFSYLPFGEGPRFCIGSRFGIMQTKLALAAFLSRYEVAICEKTKMPLEYDKKSFILTADGGIWLKIKKRKV